MEEAMNCLFFIHSMRAGGAERVTANLASHWVERGWEVTVVTLESREQDFYDLPLAVQRVDLNLAEESRDPLDAVINNLRRIAALRSVLRKIQPDVAIGMMSTAAVLLLLAAWRLSCVTIVSEHIYPPMIPLKPMWERLRRWAYPLAHRVVMLTIEGLDWLSEEIPKARGVVIPNPIPFPLHSSEPLIEPDSVIEQGRRLLLAVGRLDKQKGFDHLLQVFSHLAPSNPDWDLVILGEGPLRTELEFLARQLGLQERASLPGRAGNICDWYQRADLYVMSSRFEGFPNSLGEAMAHGCPAVSFDCDTGPRDIIRHNVDGLLVPNGDVAALKDALEYLMRDEKLRKQFAAKAVDVRDRFSLEKISEMWAALLNELQHEALESGS
ncbi:glycosyltransferase family 4 protein [Parathermosynechococcus lividus]|nr:glycosyltransferase family 4 protein [Thermostichus lividus]